MLAKFAKPAGRLDRSAMRYLYLCGLSTRQVGKVLGCSSTYTWKVCKDIARTHSESAKLRHPSKLPITERTARLQARKLTELELGRKLLRDEHVHHIDGDPFNNIKTNRQVLSSRVHAHVHHPTNPIPRHLRPTRQVYMRRYLKEYNKTYLRER